MIPAADSPNRPTTSSAESRESTAAHALAADYAHAGFGGELTPGTRPALVLVDPARAYIDPGCSLYAGVEQSVEAMRTLLTAVREAGFPVIVTEVGLRADGADAGVFFRKAPSLRAFCEGSAPRSPRI